MEKNQRSTFGMAAADPFEGCQQAAIGRSTGAQIKGNTRWQIVETLDAAENLVNRIKAITGRLCGEIPEVCRDEREPTDHAMLPALAQNAARMSGLIRSAHDDLDRLQSHFE